MATYPSGIVSLTNPTAADSMATVNHAAQHMNANDEIEAVETELGIEPKGAKATVRARLDDVDTALGLLAPKANPTFTGVIVGDTQGFVDINRYGFLNQTETTIAFDGTSVFTLGDAGAGWSYYRAGIKHTITGNKTIDLLTIDSPLTDGKVYYIYIDGSEGTLLATSAWTLTDTKVPVATVLWNDTLTPKYWLADERHTCLIDRRQHYLEHFGEGAKLITRGATAGATANTDTNVAKTFSIATSTLADEDIIHAEAALPDPDGTATDYTVFYRTAADAWAWKKSNMPFVYNVGNTNDRIQWDNAGTMTDSTGGAGGSTRWLNSYVLATCFEGAAEYVVIPGQAIFTSLAAAQAEAFSSFTLTGFPIQEAAFMYRVTWSTVTSTSQGKCRMAVLPVAINGAAVSAIGSGATVDHNTLAGLQGGTTAEYYHLTAEENTYKITATIGTATGDLLTFSAASVPAVLAIGTAGQVLSVGTGGSPVWTAQVSTAGNIAASVGTAEGDLITFSAANTPIALAKGTAGQVLTMGTENRPVWSAQVSTAGNIAASIGTAKGDLITFSSAGTPAAVAIGTAGQVLTVGTGGSPVWATASTAGGASITRATFGLAALSNTVTGGTLTITHSLGLAAPYSVFVVVYNNSAKQIIPDDITGLTNTAVVDLTSFGAISGTWGYAIIAG